MTSCFAYALVKGDEIVWEGVKATVLKATEISTGVRLEMIAPGDTKITTVTISGMRSIELVV